jgi:hypothetical protein
VHAHEVRAAEVVAVLHAVARIHELLGEHLHGVALLAAREAAEKLQVQHLGVVVLEHHVLDLDALELLLVLRPLLDVTVQVAVLRDRVTPKLASTAGLLAHLEFDALFLFVFGQLHGLKFPGRKARKNEKNAAWASPWTQRGGKNNKAVQSGPSCYHC